LRPRKKAKAPGKHSGMRTKDLQDALQKHEEECSKRFADVERKIDRLDTKLWGLAILIIIASGLEQLL